MEIREGTIFLSPHPSVQSWDNVSHWYEACSLVLADWPARTQKQHTQSPDVGTVESGLACYLRSGDLLPHMASFALSLNSKRLEPYCHPLFTTLRAHNENIMYCFYLVTYSKKQATIIRFL